MGRDAGARHCRGALRRRFPVGAAVACDFEGDAWPVAFDRLGLDPSRQERDELDADAQDIDLRKSFEASGFQTLANTTAAAAATYVADEVKRWKPVLAQFKDKPQ